MRLVVTTRVPITIATQSFERCTGTAPINLRHEVDNFHVPVASPALPFQAGTQ